MDFDTHSCDVFLFKFSSTMTLHEGGFAGTSITDQKKFPGWYLLSLDDVSQTVVNGQRWYHEDMNVKSEAGKKNRFRLYVARSNAGGQAFGSKHETS